MCSRAECNLVASEVGSMWQASNVSLHWVRGIGIGNFWEINLKTISYRQVTFSVGTVQENFAEIITSTATKFSENSDFQNCTGNFQSWRDRDVPASLGSTYRGHHCPLLEVESVYSSTDDFRVVTG